MFLNSRFLVPLLTVRTVTKLRLITPSAPVIAFVAAHWVAISIGLSVLTSGYTLYQLSNLKTPSNLNRTQQSPNNALAGRTNEPRVLQRIEDIYGTVRAYPSLLQPVYSKYINNVQYEYSYMCIGRGWYAVNTRIVTGKQIGRAHV